MVNRRPFFANQVKQREEKEEVVETRKGKVGNPSSRIATFHIVNIFIKLI